MRTARTVKRNPGAVHGTFITPFKRIVSSKGSPGGPDSNRAKHTDINAKRTNMPSNADALGTPNSRGRDKLGSRSGNN
ncbi:hypothetical protein N7491_001066 [Penicillium cf. griseofulvum]|uniref:Uncharacterized protein n=1 Tax=Penicillium cf. griseofulvum TaxID=2972120 RepID=A0A9W9M908_9EURO|nr:hypothetical protein N7472_006201 [Penicillium cf. griseofulvum]KAJ5444984.1 hypothetical protein N7491_001066 [Penicillium cf. griseofulvum]KAJ5446698.1 hypothetical protein N7445_001519 [Penicillium cf. griseofulvum]